ncbi:MAG: hypothetical protein GX247_00020 [Mollicutes bacterium]|nr:hypothetical protein [Mollicutes bacterium]
MDFVYLSNLYDYYQNLLTEKQQQYFEDYYFNNLSLSEISTNYVISRNAVHKQLKEVENKLYDYESKLHLYEKRLKLEKIINNIQDEKLKKELEKLI